jgi:hypothetical protein
VIGFGPISDAVSAAGCRGYAGRMSSTRTCGRLVISPEAIRERRMAASWTHGGSGASLSIMVAHYLSRQNRLRRDATGALVGLEPLELFGDLGPGAARELLRPPCLPVRAVASINRVVPATPGLVLVNRSFEAPAPGLEARLECQTRA